MIKFLASLFFLLIASTSYASRNKEPLEYFDISQLQVKSVEIKDNLNIAYVESQDNVVYPVKVGNYLGRNNGLVFEISSTFVKVREMVRSKNGHGWKERDLTLKVKAD